MKNSRNSCSWQRFCSAIAVAFVFSLGTPGSSWAGELEIERASISRDGDTLRVRGKNAPGTVTVVYPGDGTVIGTASPQGDDRFRTRPAAARPKECNCPLSVEK